MERFPRAAGFVFGKAETVAPRGTQGSFVHFAGGKPADVADDKAEGASNNRVGAKAGAKAAGISLDAQTRRDRPVDNNDLVSPPGSRGGAGQVKAIAKGGPNRSDHHRKVFRPAAGHNRIDRQLFQSSPGVPRLHNPQRAGRRPGNGRQHIPHSRLGRRNNRQPISPTLPPKMVLHRGVVRRDTGAAGLQLRLLIRHNYP